MHGMTRRTEFHAACGAPNECLESYMANCEWAICLEPRDTLEEMHVCVCKDDTIQGGFIPVEKGKTMSGREGGERRE